MRYIVMAILDTIIVFALLFIFVVFTLGGCARYEGDGFTNGGVARPPACIKGRKGNVETWGNC